MNDRDWCATALTRAAHRRAALENIRLAMEQRHRGQIVPGSVRMHDDCTWSAVALGAVQSVTIDGTITA